MGENINRDDKVDQILRGDGKDIPDQILHGTPQPNEDK